MLKKLIPILVAFICAHSSAVAADDLKVSVHERKVPFSEVKSVPSPYGPPKIKLRRMIQLMTIKDPKALSPKYDPTPVPNNLQIYPFRLTVPTEGVSILKAREMTFFSRHTFLDGSYTNSDSTHETDIDQWYMEQTIGVKIGLPRHWQLLIQVPLYHYKGTSSFQQNGVELLGVGNNSTRNFWGGPAINLKHPFAYFEDEDLYLTYSIWYQFPETNTRANGGTSAAHWAINGIAMKKWGEKTLHFNLGYESAGDLKVLNNQTLDQGFGVFSSLTYSQPISEENSWESQFHLSQNISDGVDAINDFNAYASLGYRHQHDHHSTLISAIFGIDHMPDFGLNMEFGYTW
jgi:hypothetical protein